MNGEEAKSARESELVTELGRSDKSVAELSSIVDDLYAKLGSVIRDEPEPESEESDLSTLVDRAHRVRDIRISIDRSTSKLHRLIDLLEV